ncbi:hypothetical protein CsatA_009067 [Cannabis sativa]
MSNKRICGPENVALNGVRSEDEKASSDDDSYLPGLPNELALQILTCLSRLDYPILACLNNKYKSLIGNEYLYKLRRQSGLTEQWIYISCSLGLWEAFDPKTRRWRNLPKMPCDYCFNCADKESLGVGTELLVFGREIPGLVVWKYSSLSHAWSKNPPLNYPRCLFGSSSYKEIGVLAGGCDPVGKIVDYAELYNSEHGTWQVLPNLNRARKLSSGFYMDGKFHVIGGMSAEGKNLNCGEVYDMKKEKWSVIENMHPRPMVGKEESTMRSPPLVAVVKNELYYADLVTNTMMKYKKSDNTWKMVKILPLRANAVEGWGVAFRGCGNKLVVIGGANHANHDNKMILMYSWEPDRDEDWSMDCIRYGVGSFVYNCAIMGC